MLSVLVPELRSISPPFLNTSQLRYSFSYIDRLFNLLQFFSERDGFGLQLSHLGLWILDFTTPFVSFVRNCEYFDIALVSSFLGLSF